MRSAILAIIGVPLFVFASNVCAEPWRGPDASRVPSGSKDIDFALSEVCYPYLLNNASLDDISRRPGYKVIEPTNPENGGSVLTLIIGGKDMSVLVEQFYGNRNCSISVRRGDNDALHAAVLTRLTQWPVSFVPARSGIEPGPLRTEELCGVSDTAPFDRVKFFERGEVGTESSFMVDIWREPVKWPTCRPLP